MVDSVSVRLKTLACRKNAFKHSFLQWNAGTACVSECMLKTLACRGLRVGPSKVWSMFQGPAMRASHEGFPDSSVPICPCPFGGPICPFPLSRPFLKGPTKEHSWQGPGHNHRFPGSSFFPLGYLVAGPNSGANLVSHFSNFGPALKAMFDGLAVRRSLSRNLPSQTQLRCPVEITHSYMKDFVSTEALSRTLVALYRAIRIRIRIAWCQQPAKRQKHKPCETQARFSSPTSPCW